MKYEKFSKGNDIQIKSLDGTKEINGCETVRSWGLEASKEAEMQILILR
jgi:hypothetical protein